MEPHSIRNRRALQVYRDDSNWGCACYDGVAGSGIVLPRIRRGGAERSADAMDHRVHYPVRRRQVRNGPAPSRASASAEEIT